MLASTCYVVYWLMHPNHRIGESWIQILPKQSIFLFAFFDSIDSIVNSIGNLRFSQKVLQKFMMNIQTDVALQTFFHSNLLFKFHRKFILDFQLNLTQSIRIPSKNYCIFFTHHPLSLQVRSRSLHVNKTIS